MKSRMRALIDKRKTIQAHLAGKLSRNSAAFIALYDGLRYFERDLSKLQVSYLGVTGYPRVLTFSTELHRNECYRVQKDSQEVGQAL